MKERQYRRPGQKLNPPTRPPTRPPANVQEDRAHRFVDDGLDGVTITPPPEEIDTLPRK